LQTPESGVVVFTGYIIASTGLERLGNLHEELILLIGAEKATQAIIEALARPEVSA